MTDNLRTLRPYLRTDIQVEGLRRQALNRRYGAVMDEYYTGRLIPHQDSPRRQGGRVGGGHHQAPGAVWPPPPSGRSGTSVRGDVGI
jgi:hypothetical protein